MRRTLPRPASRRLTALATLLGLALLCTAAQAQWTWRDKTGRVTASDLPPPRDVPEKDIISRPPARPVPTQSTSPTQPRQASPGSPASSPVSATPAPAPVDRELESKKKAAEAEKSAQAKAEETRQNQLRADNCRRARAQVLALENGQRMARVNEKGEREVLDDKGRAEETRRARDVITSDCR